MGAETSSGFKSPHRGRTPQGLVQTQRKGAGADLGCEVSQVLGAPFPPVMVPGSDPLTLPKPPPHSARLSS